MIELRGAIAGARTPFVINSPSGNCTIDELKSQIVNLWVTHKSNAMNMDIHQSCCTGWSEFMTSVSSMMYPTLHSQH